MFQSTVRVRFAAVVCISLLLAATATAEIPQYISYQGRITDTAGNPVADGSYTMRFRIYDALSGGSLLWDSNNQSVTTGQGVANVLLGESPQPALNLAFDADYWLLVTFAGVDQSPRVRLTSSGYSYMASGLVPGTIVSGSISSGAYAAIRGVNTDTSGNTYGGCFESHSTAGCGIIGRAWTTAGVTNGVWGQNESTNGYGVYGYAAATTGTTKGIEGQSKSPTGYGVVGYASASTGTNYGVCGKTNSPDGFGVVGIQPGYSPSDIGTYPEPGGFFAGAIGVMGVHKNGAGQGVMGWAANTTGVGDGVFGLTDSDQGTAVNGWATATTGATYGGFFRTDSPTGTGIGAQATKSTGVSYGVYGLSASTAGYGVYGIGTASTGVNYGIYGRTNSSAGYAGYFQGNARVTGNLTVDGTLSGAGIGDITSVNAGTGLTGGATSGDATLHVAVPLVLSASHSNPIIQGTNTATTGTSPGVRGESSSTSGRGVEGVATATTGQNVGVFGSSSSSSGAGIQGTATATTGSSSGGTFNTSSTSGYGVYAYASAAGGPNAGVYGISSSTSGWGVYGNAEASSGSTRGVEGYSSSSEGVGVRGVAAAATGITRGGEFISSSTQGQGVYGSVTPTTGATYGGYFRTRSVAGWGVYGIADLSSPADRFGVQGYCFPAENWGIGVKGEGGYRGVHGVSTHTTGSHTTYGVYGEASGGAVNYGVYSSGNFGASGTKSAVVRTEDGPKAVYCMEATEVWFEDFGSGEIQDGQAVVGLAGDFLQTVAISEQHPFKVFITPKARLGDWWVEDGTGEFRLVAPDALDGARFDYRVVAKRSGYEEVRLEPRPEAYGDHFLYPSLSDVPASHQAEWLKADAVRNEKAPERGGDR